jgi:hypothetical protein
VHLVPLYYSLASRARETAPPPPPSARTRPRVGGRTAPPPRRPPSQEATRRAGCKELQEYPRVTRSASDLLRLPQKSVVEHRRGQEWGDRAGVTRVTMHSCTLKRSRQLRKTYHTSKHSRDTVPTPLSPLLSLRRAALSHLASSQARLIRSGMVDESDTKFQSIPSLLERATTHLWRKRGEPSQLRLRGSFRTRKGILTSSPASSLLTPQASLTINFKATPLGNLPLSVSVLCTNAELSLTSFQCSTAKSTTMSATSEKEEEGSVKSSRRMLSTVSCSLKTVRASLESRGRERSWARR